MTVPDNQSKTTKELWAWASAAWCHFMHGKITWPIHGRYRCSRCNRVYVIAWSEHAVRT